MAKFTKPFMQELRLSWQREFPFLQPASANIIPNRSQSITYTYHTGSATNLFYHFAILFTSKQPGEFTVEIFISDKPTQETMTICWPDDIKDRKLGQYRIGWFVDGKDHWWGLKDNVAESNAFMKSLDADFPSNLQMQKRQYLWLPSSLDQPLNSIINEAIADLNQKMKDHVFPKLDIT